MVKYELMKIVKREKSSCRPDGIDSESETLGSALEIIRHLLKYDESLKGYKLTKKKKENRR